MYVRPAHFDLPCADQLTQSTASQAVLCLAQGFEASDLLPYATRETLEELGLVGYQIDTFSSDYDDYIDESGMVYDAI